MNFPALLGTALIGIICCPLKALQVAGRVAESSSNNALPEARVTLFTPDIRFFHEARSAVDGTFAFSALGFGTYRLGVAAVGYEYQETSVSVTGLVVSADFALRPETNGGRWTIVGNTDP